MKRSKIKIKKIKIGDSEFVVINNEFSRKLWNENKGHLKDDFILVFKDFFLGVRKIKLGNSTNKESYLYQVFVSTDFKQQKPNSYMTAFISHNRNDVLLDLTGQGNVKIYSNNGIHSDLDSVFDSTSII